MTKFSFNGTHDFFPFFGSNFITNTYPATVQLLAIDYPTLLSLFRKSSRWSKSTYGIEPLEKWKNRLFLVHLTERDIFKVFCLLQVALWCFRKIFLTNYLGYLDWRWDNYIQCGNKRHMWVAPAFFCNLGLFFFKKNWKFHQSETNNYWRDTQFFSRDLLDKIYSAIARTDFESM